MPSFTTENSEKNRSQQRRLEINIPANIRFQDGVHYNGRTKNISFNGAFFEFKQAPALRQGEQCVFTVFLSQDDLSTTIKFRSTVKHVTAEGIGLVFDSIYPEDYTDFVYLMADNSDNPEGLLAEIKINTGINMYHR